jgi:hypothetical protein
MKRASITSIQILKKQSQHWKQRGSPPPKKIKRVSSAGKIMASISWNSQGIDYLEQGRIINGTYYADEMIGLCHKIARKGGAN